MIKNLLDKALEEKKLVSVYDYEDWDSFNWVTLTPYQTHMYGFEY